MPFERQSVRHPLLLRRATVAAVRPVVPSIVRITLEGPELSGFASLGPTDHVKVFFPDPATGELLLPDMRPEGLSRPAAAGTIISRDYTPLGVHVAADGGTTLDLDFVLHGDEGPASAWAARAAVGDELGIGGPRGSRLAPTDIGRLLDEGPGQLDEALRSLGPIDEDTFVFLAGEATTLVPLRRYLRHELGLPAEQVAASGYWKRGIVNRDHHEPLDPSDPD